MLESHTSLEILYSAEHSFLKGLESLDKGLQNDEPLLIKEAIIWVCHGIELTLKQVLVLENPLFVFNNPDDALRKLIEIRQQNNSREITILELLYSNHDVMTAGYKKLADRVGGLLVIKDLLPTPKNQEKTNLRDKLDRLFEKRNRIMHSYSRLNITDDGKLITITVNEFLDLIRNELEVKNVSYSYAFRQNIRFFLNKIKFAAEEYSPAIPATHKKVLQIAKMFSGQLVPKELFGSEDEIQLPDFSQAKITREIERNAYLVENDSDSWLIFIEYSYANKERMAQIESISRWYPKSKLWVIANTTPYKYTNFFTSTIDDVDEILKLIQ